MEKITSVNNNRIIMYSKLLDKKYRDEYNLFLLENYKLIVEALNRNNEIECIIINEQTQDKFSKLIEKYNDKIIIATNAVFAKLSDTTTSQGIIAVCKTKPQSNINSFDGKTLVLDKIQDAGNMGTILRSALGFGFNNIVLIDCVDIYNPKVIRSSGGSIFLLNITNISENELLFCIKRGNFAVFAADMDGENLYDIKTIPNNLMLIIGNEGQGIRDTIIEQSSSVSIPMAKSLESLNAAVSASIIMSYFSSLK